MVERGNVLSRNPKICASCSSMADGLEESIVSDGAHMVPGQGLTAETAEARLGTGKGRTYTLTATAVDGARNRTHLVTTCVVPHDQGWLSAPFAGAKTTPK
jgi:hypothetical protein